MTQATAGGAAAQPSPNSGRSASDVTFMKSWGRAVNGISVTLGAGLIATLAFGRLLDQMEVALEATSQVVVENSSYALAFFYIAAGASVAIARGVVSMGLGPGRSRLIGGTPMAIGIVVVALWVVSAIIQPASPPAGFWVALALPILGSIIEDILVMRAES